jgi:hypothetical protein
VEIARRQKEVSKFLGRRKQTTKKWKHGPKRTWIEMGEKTFGFGPNRVVLPSAPPDSPFFDCTAKTSWKPKPRSNSEGNCKFFATCEVYNRTSGLNWNLVKQESRIAGKVAV